MVLHAAEDVFEVVKQRLNGDARAIKFKGGKRVHLQVRRHQDDPSARRFDEDEAKLALDRFPDEIKG